MTALVFLTGVLSTLPDIDDAPLVWQTRLDAAPVLALATQAPLLEADWRDLAHRRHAETAALRRRLAKVLLARLKGCHPATVVIGRTTEGAPVVLAPPGLHISVSGQWPHSAIAVSRRAIGIDIEPWDALPPPADAMTEQEIRALAGAPDQDRLVRWVAKEAHAKLFGAAARVDARDIDTVARGAHYIASSQDGSSVVHIRRDADTVMAVANRNALHPRLPSAAPTEARTGA
jgi:phosphopantetheinyl transferase